MNEQDLRALIRETVLKALAARGMAGSAPHGTDLSSHHEEPAVAHPSHGLYVTVVNAGDACVIEPGVTCNHCGYCKSHGH
jgi:threonine dehydrogenase-like Zn-dependent dehydrogenase